MAAVASASGRPAGSVTARRIAFGPGRSGVISSRTRASSNACSWTNPADGGGDGSAAGGAGGAVTPRAPASASATRPSAASTRMLRRNRGADLGVVSPRSIARTSAGPDPRLMPAAERQHRREDGELGGEPPAVRGADELVPRREMEPRQEEAAHREAPDRQHRQAGEPRDREREALGLAGRRRRLGPASQKTVAKPSRPPTHDAMARRWSASAPRISHRPSVAAAPWLTSPPVITTAAASHDPQPPVRRRRRGRRRRGRGGAPRG